MKSLSHTTYCGEFHATTSNDSGVGSVVITNRFNNIVAQLHLPNTKLNYVIFSEGGNVLYCVGNQTEGNHTSALLLKLNKKLEYIQSPKLYSNSIYNELFAICESGGELICNGVMTYYGKLTNIILTFDKDTNILSRRINDDSIELELERD